MGKQLSERDNKTGAMINVQEARDCLSTGNLQGADEALAVAQRQLIYAGAKDIGPLENANNDYSNAIFTELSRREDKIERLEGELEEYEETIQELRDIYYHSPLNRYRSSDE